MKDLFICSGNKEHEPECSRIHQINARREDIGTLPEGTCKGVRDQVAGVRVAYHVEDDNEVGIYRRSCSLM